MAETHGDDIENDYVENVIEMMRNHSCFYDKSSSDFSKTKLRNEIIFNFCKAFGYDEAEVKKKVTNLKQQYRNNVNRMKDVTKSGAGIVKEPTWQYFKSLSFLSGTNISAPEGCNIDSNFPESPPPSSEQDNSCSGNYVLAENVEISLGDFDESSCESSVCSGVGRPHCELQPSSMMSTSSAHHNNIDFSAVSGITVSPTKFNLVMNQINNANMAKQQMNLMQGFLSNNENVMTRSPAPNLMQEILSNNDNWMTMSRGPNMTQRIFSNNDNAMTMSQQAPSNSTYAVPVTHSSVSPQVENVLTKISDSPLFGQNTHKRSQSYQQQQSPGTPRTPEHHQQRSIAASPPVGRTPSPAGRTPSPASRAPSPAGGIPSPSGSTESVIYEHFRTPKPPEAKKKKTINKEPESNERIVNSLKGLVESVSSVADKMIPPVMSSVTNNVGPVAPTPVDPAYEASMGFARVISYELLSMPELTRLSVQSDILKLIYDAKYDVVNKQK